MAWKIGLVLTVKVLLLMSQAEGQCSEGDIRLEGGSRESEGRVNVCVGGRWGTVCDDGFDAVDARVVCFQLGYSRINATALYFTGEGSGIIAMDDVECSGTEHRLIDCTHNTLHDCLHLEDVAVRCTETVVALRTSSSATSVTISWTAPFSLDVTGVDPDIWYSVLIYTVTDEPTAVPCTDCINITETHYTFTPDYPSPCHKYIFTVIPLNGAGQGETSHNVTGYTIDGDVKLVFTRVEIRRAIEGCVVTFQVCGDVDSVSGYALRGLRGGVDGEPINMDNNAPLTNGRFITYTLPENSMYSTTFEVIISTGTRNVSNNTFTTYDVQNTTASVTEDGSQIAVTGDFITDSLAGGCFIVLQSDYTTEDIYTALLRQGSEQSVSGTISVPPSTYTVYAYDLEEDLLPNPMPAITSGVTLTVNADYTSNPPSMFLESATIHVSQKGTEVHVQIICEFSEDYPESSCVLIYREYGNTTLIVEEYSHNNKPPDNIVLDKPDSTYTFAIFGKNGNAGIDLKPVKTERYVPTTGTTQEPSQTSSSLSKCSSSNHSFGEGVGVGIAVGIMTSSVVVVVTIIIMKCRQIRGQRKVTLTRNVAYEVPSIRTASSGKTQTRTPVYEECT